MRGLQTFTAHLLGPARCAVIGLIPTMLFAACSVATVAPGSPARDALPLPGEIADRFDYAERGAAVTSWTCVLKASRESYDIYTVKGSVTPKGDNNSMPVEAEYWLSKGRQGPRPAVIVTPILGGGNDIARLVAREFAEAGLHGVIVWRGVKVLTPEWSATEVEQNLRRGIAARRRVIDWLETRPEVDMKRIGAFGVSMGGILTSVLAPVEPRIHSAVVALAGGDLASVVMHSDEPRVRAYRKARVQTEKVDDAALETSLREALVSDPLLVAPYADPRRMLLFVARWDEVVPTENQLKLRDALGKPRTYDLPTGHYATMLLTPFVRSRSTSWLRDNMKSPNPSLEVAAVKKVP